MESGDLLLFEGHAFLRQRLILSCLSGKSIRIRNIRLNGETPGIKDYEINFIRLVDSISNGAKIEVNDTGTVVKFTPGVLVGGNIDHQCCLTRGIGYYLYPLFIVAPFCKRNIKITLRGVTNNQKDPTVDMIRLSVYPVLKKFMKNDENLSLKMTSRGLPPKGGGVVQFCCPTRRELKPFQWMEAGKVKYIRGVAYACRVPPAVGNRMLASAKEVFKNHLQDVYFTVDNSKGASPGFGICTVAETHKGTFYATEAMNSVAKASQEASEVEHLLPEDIGKEAAYKLLNEIASGGCVDSLSQSLVLAFMVLCSKDISKVVIGMPSSYSKHFLRLLKLFFGVTFKIDEHVVPLLFEDDLKLGAPKYAFTCMGIGYANYGKPIL